MSDSINRDDCLSTKALRDWLETVRLRLVAEGTDIHRPDLKAGEVSEELTERQQKVAQLIERLTRGISVEPAERTAEEQAGWLLAYILDWHRREDKAAWWEYFRLSALSDEELLEERSAISGLAFVGAIGGTARAPVHRYSFPLQETNIRGGEELQSQGGSKLGTVTVISVENRTIDIKKRKDTNSYHPAVFAHEVINSRVLADALLRIGEHVATAGIDGPGPYAAARDLFMQAAPRTQGQPLQQVGETSLEAGTRLAPYLSGFLPIQGPPADGWAQSRGLRREALVCWAFLGPRLGPERVVAGGNGGPKATTENHIITSAYRDLLRLHVGILDCSLQSIVLQRYRGENVSGGGAP